MFDMDGVLVDSEPAHMRVSREVMAEHGVPLPGERDWERVFYGRPDRDGLRDWLREHDLGADIAAIMQEKVQRFAAAFTDLVEPFADGQWLARELHERGI